jgi:hypothetical protein
METQKIFYQSSLPRSGSTLLQNIIGQNPDFYVTPTSGVLELLYAARHNYTNSPEFQAQDQQTMEDGFRGFCKGGFEGFYKNITNKPYVIDKSRGWGYYKISLNFFNQNRKLFVWSGTLELLSVLWKKSIDNQLIHHLLLLMIIICKVLQQNNVLIFGYNLNQLVSLLND